MTKQEVMERLCTVTAEVAERRFGWGVAADCWCGKSGFEFQSMSEKVIKFIEEAVEEKLNGN